MGITTLAGDGDAQHSVTAIFFRGEIFRCDGCVEAGPASPGFEFGVGQKESRIAANAAVQTAIMKVAILTGAGPFCARMTRDFIRFRSKLLPPLLVRFHNLGYT